MHELGYYLDRFFAVETEGQQDLCWLIIKAIINNESYKVNSETASSSKVL